MNEPICLSPNELNQLTNKKQSGAQASALNFMGITHRIRPDGTVMVLRADVVKTAPKDSKTSPDFGAIGDVA